MGGPGESLGEGLWNAAGDMWDSGVDMAKEALVESTKSGIAAGQEVMKDGEALLPLVDDFHTLYEAQVYFESNMEELESFGLADILIDPKGFEAKVTEANGHILKTRAAILAVKGQNIRFSQDFMGPTVQQFEATLERFDSIAYKLITALAKQISITKDSSWSPGLQNPVQNGIRIAKALGVDNVEQVYDLSITLQYTHSLVRLTKTDLESLIDPALPEGEACNNTFINMGIQGYEAYEDMSHTFDRWKLAAEAIEAYDDGRYVEAARKAAEYVKDEDGDR